MRLLLTGDEHCMMYNGDYYVSDFAVILFNRYLKCFEHVDVALRTKTITDASLLGKFRNKVTDDRLTIKPLPFFQGPKQLSKCFNRLLWAADSVVDGCDIAILRLPSTVGFAVWRSCRRRHIPYATEIVFDCKDAYLTSRSLTNKLLWTCMHRLQVKACNEALGVSCVTARYLQNRYFPKRKDAATSHYSSIEMPGSFLYHEREYPQKSCFRIVHVANQVQFNSRKGHNQIIDALSIVKKKGLDVEVVFVGEDYHDGFRLLGDYAHGLGLDDNVKFSGFLSHKQLRETLIESDLAVLPTKAEGLPRVVIEAMAVGLPVITTPVSGNPELIDADYLIDYYDIKSMAEKIVRLLSNKDTYQNVSKTNFERSRQYVTDVLNPRRCEFYNQLKEKLNHVSV